MSQSRSLGEMNRPYFLFLSCDSLILKLLSADWKKEAKVQLVSDMTFVEQQAGITPPSELGRCPKTTP